jgi:hypothetical protein
MMCANSHLKPGAWFEQNEGSVAPKSDDDTVRPGTAFWEWGEVSLRAGDAFGKTLRVVDEMKQNMIEAGFIDVVEHRYKWPIGSTSLFYDTGTGPGITDDV